MVPKAVVGHRGRDARASQASTRPTTGHARYQATLALRIPPDAHTLTFKFTFTLIFTTTFTLTLAFTLTFTPTLTFKGAERRLLLLPSLRSLTISSCDNIGGVRVSGPQLIGCYITNCVNGGE